MELETLQLLWYLVFVAAIFAYSALDGFDIGVGCLHLFARSDLDRRIFMNAIGPVWDSNSLWVVITAGALLAGFPGAFATLFSSLYLPMMILIFGYIYRAVAIEFRSKMASPKWRTFWDWMFSLSSYCLAFGFGIVLANLIHGIPIDHKGYFIKSLSVLLSPYACLLGLFTTSLFMLHGALYLQLKTEGELQERLRRWCWRLFGLFTLLWLIVNLDTPLFESQVTKLISQRPIFYPFLFIGLGGLIGLFISLSHKNNGWAFISSCILILSLVLCFGIGTYPDIVRSSLNKNYSLTIFNSSSSPLTLKILLGMALAGIPLFLLYIGYTYRTFKGKVEMDTMSY